MKRQKQHLLMVLFVSFVSMTFAQTQRGYVRTIGRPGKPGAALSGVSVRVKGEHNATLSKNDGTFSMLLKGKKNGDAYSLQQVQKAGYELNEKDVLGRQFAFSDKVPLIIVMVSTVQLQADKRRIENIAYQVAEKNYKTKLALLEHQRESDAVTAEQYRQQLQDLQDKFEKYQSMIDDLSNHYAHVDYDNLDEQEREINLCIENGDLEYADSLIHVFFDPVDVLKRNKEALSKIEDQMAHAQALQAQAHADMAAVLKQQEKDAEHLYQLYTIALAKFEYDKAESYISTRAELDSVNIEWQDDAADFYLNYRISANTALQYYKRNYKTQLQINQGDKIPPLDERLVALGACYGGIGQFKKAKRCIEEAIDIAVKYDSLNPDLIYYFDVMATLYMNFMDEEKALVYLEKEMEIYKELSKPIPYSYYSNIGKIYRKLGMDSLSTFYLEKALSVMERNRISDANVSLYNDLGTSYLSSGKYNKALECYEKAFSISNKINGEIHPYVAECYSNIGDVYNKTKQYTLAITNYQKAIDIYTQLKVNIHLGICYFKMAETYKIQQKLEEKNNYLFKALKSYLDMIKTWDFETHNIRDIFSALLRKISMHIDELSDSATLNDIIKILLQVLERQIYILGEEHPDVAFTNNAIGIAYYELEDYDNALSYYTKSIEIDNKIYGENSRQSAITYFNIGMCYAKCDDYMKAVINFQKTIEIQEPMGLVGYSNVATCYNKIGEMYYYKEDKNKALDYYQKAQILFEKVNGREHPDVAMIYNNIGLVYNSLGDFERAIESYNNAIAILEKIYEKGYSDIVVIYNNLGESYESQGNYPNALDNYMKAMSINEKTYGNEHINVAESYGKIGFVYIKQGNYTKALECCQKTLDIIKKGFGEEHPQISMSYSNIGYIYECQGDYTKALEYYQTALEIRKNTLGNEHVDVAMLYDSIGDMYDNLGNNEKTLECYQKALDIYLREYGSIHPDVASSYNNIASIYDNQGDYIKALEYLYKALSTSEAVQGNEHPDTKIVRDNIIITEYKEALLKGHVSDFLKDKVFTAVIVDEYVPARQQGMDGEYILLEYNEWTQDSPSSLFVTNEELKDKPKYILVMKDGLIMKHYFENTIGANLGIKIVDKKEKLMINDVYLSWKKQHGK